MTPQSLKSDYSRGTLEEHTRRKTSYRHISVTGYDLPKTYAQTDIGSWILLYPINVTSPFVRTVSQYIDLITAPYLRVRFAIFIVGWTRSHQLSPLTPPVRMPNNENNPGMHSALVTKNVRLPEHQLYWTWVLTLCFHIL